MERNENSDFYTEYSSLSTYIVITIKLKTESCFQLQAAKTHTKVKTNGQRIPPTREAIVHIANALLLHTVYTGTSVNSVKF